MSQRFAAILFILSALFLLYYFDSQEGAKINRKLKSYEFFPKYKNPDLTSPIKNSKISKELNISLSAQPELYELLSKIKSKKLSGHAIDKKMIADILLEIEKSIPENEDGSLVLEADIFSTERIANIAIAPKQLVIQFSMIEIETNNKIAEFSINLASKKINE